MSAIAILVGLVLAIIKINYPTTIGRLFFYCQLIRYRTTVEYLTTKINLIYLNTDCKQEKRQFQRK